MDSFGVIFFTNSSSGIVPDLGGPVHAWGKDCFLNNNGNAFENWTSSPEDENNVNSFFS